jgi:hypothetical protein
MACFRGKVIQLAVFQIRGSSAMVLAILMHRIILKYVTLMVGIVVRELATKIQLSDVPLRKGTSWQITDHLVSFASTLPNLMPSTQTFVKPMRSIE